MKKDVASIFEEVAKCLFILSTDRLVHENNILLVYFLEIYHGMKSIKYLVINTNDSGVAMDIRILVKGFEIYSLSYSNAFFMIF